MVNINKEKNFISAVIYIRNNEKEVERFLEFLNTTLEFNFEQYEIICVNDASYDQSVQKIRNFAKKIKNAEISILNMSFYHGKEISMNAGVDLSIGDFVYEFDSIDIDYTQELLMEIYNKSLQGYDLVKAIPDTKTRLSSKMFYKVFNSYASLPKDLKTETFSILSRRAINRIKNVNNEILYRKVAYASSGLPVAEVTYLPTTNKESSKDISREKYRRKLAIDSLILFTDVAYVFATRLTFLMMLVTVLVAIYAIFTFCGNNPVPGWTTNILFLSFGFFSMFAIMTILIKYLSLIVELIFKKEKYVIESIEKVKK